MAPVVGLTPAVPSSLTRKYLPSSRATSPIVPFITMTPISGKLPAAWTVGGSPMADEGGFFLWMGLGAWEYTFQSCNS